MGILSGLTQRGAETDPSSDDARLLGRTYAIPFDVVWSAALRLAGGELRRWSMLSADDLAGVISAGTRPLFFGQGDRVRIEIGLDENAQTRVDLSSSSRSERPDLGRNRRAIGRFLSRLDAALGAKPEQILDATKAPSWLESR
ncbi:MAG: DUF1499 domain-containing protein [Longimicrobiales bacterium]